MSELSSLGIDEYAANLDEIWQQVCKILVKPFQEFDDSFAVARKMRQTELYEWADKMKAVLTELLSVPLYMGTMKRDEYSNLEEVLVRNIARICRIDVDTGVELQRLFFQHGRSVQATFQIHWKSFRNRVGFWMDDGVRGQR